MGTFHVTCEVEHVAREAKSATVPGLLVDAGSEATWIPAAILKSIGVKPRKKDVAFVMANGQTVTRNVGFAVLRVDPRAKRLVAAGPHPAA